MEVVRERERREVWEKRRGLSGRKDEKRERVRKEGRQAERE